MLAVGYSRRVGSWAKGLYVVAEVSEGLLFITGALSWQLFQEWGQQVCPYRGIWRMHFHSPHFTIKIRFFHFYLDDYSVCVYIYYVYFLFYWNGLWSIVSQRIRHNWSDLAHMHAHGWFTRLSYNNFCYTAKWPSYIYIF